MPKLPSFEEVYSEMSEEDRALLPPETREGIERSIALRQEGLREIDRLAAAREFRNASMLIGSEDRARYFADWDDQYHLTVEETRDLLAAEWSFTEAWSGDERLREKMMDLLRRVAPLYVYDETDREQEERTIALSPEPLTIYRGTLGETPGSGSWSLDKETAQRFVSQMLGPRGRLIFGIEPTPGLTPGVWEAQVYPDKILGYFNDRREREVVVDANSLFAVRKIQEVVR